MNTQSTDELTDLLSPEFMDIVLKSCDLSRNDIQCAFAGGSVVQGWGNEDSDIDIYLLAYDLPRGYSLEEVHDTRFADGGIPVSSLNIKGRKIDVEIWTVYQAEQVLGLVEMPESERSSSALEGLSYFELDFLEKLGHGLSVFGHGEVAAYKHRLVESAWTEMLLEQALILSDIYLEDAVGQLESSDLISSVLSAKLAFGHSVDAIAISSGLIGRSPKWRARRMNLADSRILSPDEYWQIETMQNYDPKNPAEWVRRVVSISRRVSATVEI